MIIHITLDPAERLPLEATIAYAAAKAAFSNCSSACRSGVEFEGRSGCRGPRAVRG